MDLNLTSLGPQERADKMFTDMYIGDKGPSITVRLANVENSVDRIIKGINKLAWIGISLIATGVFNAVIHLVGK